MAQVFFMLAMAALAGTVISLLAGMVALSGGRQKDRAHSNKMMQLRVAMQGLTVVFLLLAYLSK